MPQDIIPGGFWRLGALRPSVWDDEDWGLAASTPNGLAIAEDDKHIYVEASLPGIDPKDIEVTFDRGVVWIKGEAKEEEKERKWYRKATTSFSYRVSVPGDIDQNVEPEASSKNGVMTVTFTKVPESQPKKISVKTK